MLRIITTVSLVLFSLVFGLLLYQESTVTPRGSSIRTVDKGVHVHERFQNGYYTVGDADRLKNLHTKEALVLLGIVASWVAMTYSRRKIRSISQ